MKLFEGIYVVLVTPFTEERKVDFDGIKRNIEWLISEGGVHGLVSLGSTGEFASLSDEEKLEVNKTVLKSTAGRIPVIAGATAETTEKTLENALLLQKQGADGVLILPPYYYTPDQDEIIHHYSYVAERISIPIMIYNNPFSSKVDILPETIAKLAVLPNIQYIKESSGDIKRITDIRIRTNDELTVFCGWEDMAYESFLMGATGWVCVLGNIAPKECVALFNTVVKEKNLEKGWALYKCILPMLRYLEYEGKTQKTLKYILDDLGLAGNYSSNPKLPLLDKDKQEISSIMNKLKGVAVL